MRCFIVEEIEHILIGLKDIARFNLEGVITILGHQALMREKTTEVAEGFTCFPVSIDTMLPSKDEILDRHDDPQIQEILERHEVIFRDKLDKDHQNAFVPMNLDLLDPTAPMPSALKTKTRPQPIAWTPEIAKQLKDYENQGIIEPCTSEFWSQVLMVKKADGKLRLCVDYRALNLLLRHEGWELPRIQELLTKLAGKKFFYTCV